MRLRFSLAVLLMVCACATGQSDRGPLPVTEGPSPTSPSSAKGHDAGAASDGGEIGPAEDAATEDSGADEDAGVDASAPVDASPPISDAAIDAPVVVVTPPVLDGVVQPGEYGVHANGENQESVTLSDPTSTTWYMTWTDTHLYVAVTAANAAEGVVVFIDHAPLSPSNSGTSADGTIVNPVYDNTQAGTLPIRADFVAYVKAGYNEYRTSNGANGWSQAVAAALAVQTSGTTREIAIPWSLIRTGGRPGAFSWLGYATSSTGFLYGEMPPGNPHGMAASPAFGWYFAVPNATPGSGSKPFALRLNP